MIDAYAGRRSVAFCVVLALVLSVVCAGAAHAQSEFPFDRELILDAPPMKGSKRIPVLDIANNGAAQIDLWCGSVQGQFVVAADTITVITGTATEQTCPPERVKRDEDMLQALQQVTNWRWEGPRFVLVGPTTLRFRIPTN